MTGPMPDNTTIEAAVALACRAPSLHNSQPWRWVHDKNTLQLHSDADRMLPSTDAFGRQMLLSCGAALNHAEIAFASLGWETTITRIPDPAERDLLATLDFRRAQQIDASYSDSAAAIAHRQTDRLPFAEPSYWPGFEAELIALAACHDSQVETLGAECRPALAEASALAAELRRYDSMYQDELQWWTGHSGLPEGVPEGALVSAIERRRVAVGRNFPVGDNVPRRDEVRQDRAAIMLLATDSDSRNDWLRCGEALSAVLVACTTRGFATCAMTHMTELPKSREILKRLARGTGWPQVLIRVGLAPSFIRELPTPRRPLSAVLFEAR